MNFFCLQFQLKFRFDSWGYLLVLSEVSQSVGPFETKMQVWVTLSCGYVCILLLHWINLEVLRLCGACPRPLGQAGHGRGCALFLHHSWSKAIGNHKSIQSLFQMKMVG